MSILNYIFVGFLVIFLIDSISYIGQNHPKMQIALKQWGWAERTICVIIWPIALIIFVVSFIKTYFRK